MRHPYIRSKLEDCYRYTFTDGLDFGVSEMLWMSNSHVCFPRYLTEPLRSVPQVSITIDTTQLSSCPGHQSSLKSDSIKDQVHDPTTEFLIHFTNKSRILIVTIRVRLVVELTIRDLKQFS